MVRVCKSWGQFCLTSWNITTSFFQSNSSAFLKVETRLRIQFKYHLTTLQHTEGIVGVIFSKLLENFLVTVNLFVEIIFRSNLKTEKWYQCSKMSTRLLTSLERRFKINTNAQKIFCPLWSIKTTKSIFWSYTAHSKTLLVRGYQ